MLILTYSGVLNRQAIRMRYINTHPLNQFLTQDPTIKLHYHSHFNPLYFTYCFNAYMYNLLGSHYVTVYYFACNQLAIALVDLRMVIYRQKHVVLSIFVLNTLDNVLCLTVHNICFTVCDTVASIFVATVLTYEISICNEQCVCRM